MKLTSALNEMQGMGGLDEWIAKLNLACMLLGLACNLLCVAGLSRRRVLKARFNVYLLMVAFADLVFCALVAANYTIMLQTGSRALYDTCWLACNVTDYAIGSLDSFSVLITLLVSLDRLNAIKRPLKRRFSVLFLRPWLVGTVSALAIVLIRLPDALANPRFYADEYVPTVNRLRLQNMTEAEAAQRLELARQIDLLLAAQPRCRVQSVEQLGHLRNSFNIIYSNGVVPICLNALPAFAILAVNLNLLAHLRAYERKLHRKSGSGSIAASLRRSTQQSQASQSNQRTHVATIVALSFWMFASCTPYYALVLIHWLYSAVLGLEASLPDYFRNVQAVSSFFFNSNHFINLFIYLLFHNSFRRCLFSMFRRRRSERKYSFVSKSESPTNRTNQTPV
nr:G protein-coupled receptor [Proales similis]